jgi:putative phosphoribosyl transferase
MYFKDRKHAGEVLAGELRDEWKNRSPVVVALPRGGVPVAYPIARLLDAPLDVLLVRKLGAPTNPEYAVGAIAEDGRVWVNREALAYVKPERAEMDDVASSAVREMERQRVIFRDGRPQLNVKGRAVVLVDDGLATGSTMLAAVASLKSRGASEIVVAVPVASREGVRLLEGEVDRVYVAYEPEHFRSVGEWYENFEQVSDEDVVRILKIGQEVSRGQLLSKEIEIDLEDVQLPGELTQPEDCRAWILFAHGSGSSRKSPRNARVARALNEAGFGTLLFDLLSLKESEDRQNVFDVDLLACRLAKASDWLRGRTESKGLPIGYFGASTGAAAALQACAEFKQEIFAIVSRGGRPDLALNYLTHVSAPVLLIVGGEDHSVIELNVRADERLPHSKIKIVPGAGHLFEEPGALDQVTGLAVEFFSRSHDQYKKVRHAVA